MSRPGTLEHTIIEPAGKLTLPRLRDLWEYRDLLRFLAWRDIAVKYRQTVLGAAWTVIQPLATTVLFTVIFGRIVGVQSEGVPYPVFAFAGLLVWQLFSSTLNRVAGSLTANAHLLSKIYFPRLVIPIASALPPLLDFVVSLGAMLALMAWFGIAPGWHVVLLPAWLLLAVAIALGLGLWLAALNVRYRDVGYVLPFVLQVWMFASPILYPAQLVPEHWRTLYSLNPLVAVVEGVRWSLLGVRPAPGIALPVSIGVALGLLVWGVLFFARTEETFADVV